MQTLDRASKRELDGLLRRAQPRLAWIAKTPAGSHAIHVNVIEATQTLALTASRGLEVVFDAKVRDAVARRMEHAAAHLPDSTLTAWLTDQLVIAGTALHPEPRLLITSSPQPRDAPPGPFRIWGRGLAVDVQRSEIEGGGHYKLTRVVHASRLPRTEQRPIYIATASLSLRDDSNFVSESLTALEVTTDQGQGYVKLWTEYQAIEERLTQERADQIGALHYARVSRRDAREWHFEVSDPDVMSRIGSQRDLELEVRNEGRRRPFSGTVDFEASTAGDRGRPTRLVLRTQEADLEPPAVGTLNVSIHGQRTTWKRRKQALTRLGTAQSNPALSTILEGREPDPRQGRTIKPLSPAVRELFGPAGPTSTQIEALKVALNTPDIAIIQGPPGTGKTQVIRALALRLSELGEGEETRGGLLISSFQHEAVEHVAGSIRIFGLPAVKVGRRRDRSASLALVDEWRTSLVNRLDASPQHESRPITRVLDDARRLLGGAIRGLAAGTAARALDRLLEASRAWLPPTLVSEGRSLWSELHRLAQSEARTRAERLRLRALVLGIRITEAAHQDDGPQQLTSILECARAQELELEDDELATLDDARVEDTLTDDLAMKLVGIRDRLLDHLAEVSQVLPRQFQRDDLSEWLRRTVQALRDQAKSLPDDADSVVADFKEALDTDRDAALEAISRYTSVLAATCVQSVSPVMVETVTSFMDKPLGFRTVIVDEAARANPLDLLIPMSLAGHRIILVGDHRQLPHSLEPEVERAIDQDPSIEAKELLKTSLFERLKLQLQGTILPRVVTLDRQYRMHPVLADFVSEVFYKPHGESYTSGVDGADREHGLSELGSAVAAWIEVPHSEGPEKRLGASLTRPCEAEIIAKRLKRWLVEQPTLSFAVVTFYAAQVGALWSALKREGLAEGGSDNVPYAIHRDWRSLPTGGERLRIGTVDAFQGKEFDVVLLSAVRSNSQPVDDRPASWRRKWGFLLLENRMCVALSRQRRALVMVGDPAMVEGEVAHRCVTGLSRFRTLCGGEYGRILPG
ncbi:MAG TPA: AAA domain-containing protein [Myxococcota bacterium]|nr:AAA domain-containing protein [Myxococcota bacterium]